LEEKKENTVFQAFEHASYNIRNEGREGKILPEKIFDALKMYAGEKDLPWYTLTANGVRFNQYVGAIQIGKYCIEVLPKIDRYKKDEQSAQKVLIDMLRQSGYISVKTPTESDLRLKQNFILETYVEMFLNETRQILHRGLVKYYHREEGNNNSLKGSLVFNQQIRKNNIHAERFYVRFSIYDREHPLNRILYKTLLMIGNLSISQEIMANAKAQLCLFPDLKDITISSDFFNRIRYNRKTEAYKKAIDIARLLLLNYHPDLSYGRNNVLALMFDMNDVWESWFTQRIKIAVRKLDIDVQVRAQAKKIFWYGDTGERVRQKPDIIIETDDKPQYILDTKWKIISNRPSEDDIRQMFAYNRLFCARQAFLVYPGESRIISGEFYEKDENGACGLSFIPFIHNGRLTSQGVNEFAESLISIIEFTA